MLTEKEIRGGEYHSSAENFREEQYPHLGDLRKYGRRFLGISWG